MGLKVKGRMSCEEDVPEIATFDDHDAHIVHIFSVLF